MPHQLPGGAKAGLDKLWIMAAHGRIQRDRASNAEAPEQVDEPPDADAVAVIRARKLRDVDAAVWCCQLRSARCWGQPTPPVGRRLARSLERAAETVCIRTTRAAHRLGRAAPPLTVLGRYSVTPCTAGSGTAF